MAAGLGTPLYITWEQTFSRGFFMLLYWRVLFFQVKSEGSSTGGETTDSATEDIMKRFSDSKPEIKKEPGICEYSFFYYQFILDILMVM